KDGKIMKKIIAINIIYSFCGLPTFLYAQNEVDSSKEIDINDQTQYLPDYLENVHIGMTLAEFGIVKDTLLMDVSNNAPDVWYGVREEVTDDGISEVYYKFDKEENGINIDRPLYQIDLIFSDSLSESEFLRDKFGVPQKDLGSSEYEWKFNTNKNYKLFVKQKGIEVQIFAAMPGTEYEAKNDF
ncbi:MAG: hypothetical protein OQK65_08560, partial [Chlorobium sp.]|nr:hypothetical protein [Chlorobium sp.]